MNAREGVLKVRGYGARLLDRLRALRMSQSALATKTGLSRQTIHRAIHRDELSTHVAKRIAAVVGKDLLSHPTLGRESPPTARHADAPPEKLSALGEVLELMREDLIRGGQAEMARAAGLSLTTYRRVIAGATKPKDQWLFAWGEALGLRPESMLILTTFERTNDPFALALGVQLRSWRATSGLDLHEVAEAVGERETVIAMHEVGHEETVHSFILGELAHYYGTTADVIRRAARLTLSAMKDEDRVATDRILTFEAAEREARDAQEKRDAERSVGNFTTADDLTFARMRTGLDVEDVATRVRCPLKLVDLWEEGDFEPDIGALERLAVLYRRTPWDLRYGSAWGRAWAFPNAPESRARIFRESFPKEHRTWLYGLLSELARAGFHDTELDDVRDSLTNPAFYFDEQFVQNEEERALFLHIKLRELGAKVWRHMCDAGWTDRPIEARAPLPALFRDPPVDEQAVAALVEKLEERRMGWFVSAATPSSSGV
jgi:transcriptional regulator with XRE-family HTH domain